MASAGSAPACSRISRTPRTTAVPGSSGVLDTFVTCTALLSTSNRQTSVNVPPVSTPTRSFIGSLAPVFLRCLLGKRGVFERETPLEGETVGQVGEARGFLARAQALLAPHQEHERRLIEHSLLDLAVDRLALGLVELGAALLQQFIHAGVDPARRVVQADVPALVVVADGVGIVDVAGRTDYEQVVVTLAVLLQPRRPVGQIQLQIDANL